MLNKFLYFAAPIPGTRQYMRYKSDQAISMVRFVRLTSDDQDKFTGMTCTAYSLDLMHICTKLLLLLFRMFQKMRDLVVLKQH